MNTQFYMVSCLELDTIATVSETAAATIVKQIKDRPLDRKGKYLERHEVQRAFIKHGTIREALDSLFPGD